MIGKDRRHRPPLQIVHLVIGEAHKALIGPQVVDPLPYQAAALDAGEPGQRMVLLLEAGRVVLTRRMRARVGALRRRGDGSIIASYPIIGRLSVRANAAALGRWLRVTARGQPRIFHCRGESAVEWAAALRRSFPRSGIVADIRGAWPEEALHSDGYDGPNEAPPSAVRRYHVHLSRLQAALACAGSVLSVSPGMLDWLAHLGVARNRMGYVPCAVTAVSYDEGVRMAARASLQLQGKIVYAYVGILASYHSVEEGLIRFFAEAARRYPEAHLLALTPESSRLHELLRVAGVSPDRATVINAPHEEVPRLLSAADCGLILMKPCRLAPTWQPIKFAEYLSAGLPVMVSRGVGRVDTLVAEAGAGLAVDVFGDHQAFERAVVDVHESLLARQSEMRLNAIALCQREFLWQGYISTWREAYDRALEWASVSPSPLSVRFGA